MKKTLLLYSLLLVTTVQDVRYISAAATVNNTGDQVVVKTAIDNVDSCSVSASPSGAPGVSMSPTSGTAAQSTILDFTSVTANTYLYTISCHSSYYGSTLTAGDTVTVTGSVPAPTTTTFSYSPTHDIGSKSFTATAGGNNTPTFYKYDTVDGAATACPSPLSTSLPAASSPFSDTANNQGMLAGHTYKTCIQACNAGGCGPVVSATYTVDQPAPTVDIHFSILEKTKSILSSLLF